MALSIVQGKTRTPVATELLLRTLVGADDLEGQISTGFPIVSSSTEIARLDALLVSPSSGLVVFDLVEGSELGDYESRQDDMVRVLQSRLMQHKDLVLKRELQAKITSVTFAPAADLSRISEDNETYILANDNTLLDFLRKLVPSIDQAVIYPALLSATQSVSTLRSNRAKRIVKDSDSRGSKLLQLERSIATLDHLQSKAVIETIDGVQRIRGLAGSGKTVVLALKAAYLHAQNPDWRIAVTYNTRSLADQFKRLITGFMLDQTGEEPDWTRLRILNAWGGRGATNGGVYSEFCELSGARYLDFGSASAMFGGSGAFEGACDLASAEGQNPLQIKYDVILVDEAQDLPASFLRICHRMLTDEKRLVYAYDELQSLDGRGLPSATEIFGETEDGTPVVDFESAEGDVGQRDIVLEKCYRNSRPVLVTAHALGFGIYRQSPPGQKTGLVQLFENASLWDDIGYRVEDGSLREDQAVVLGRTQESSPRFLEEHSDLEDLIHFQAFDTEEEQNAWVASHILDDLNTGELRYDDIVVINPNGITAKRNLAPLRADLLEMGVQNHHAGVDTSADVFFQRESESITFTGIHRAKGNEAGMVYIVNAQEGLDSVANLSSVRNRLFTAMTRSKAWVRVLGVGPLMKDLQAEYDQAREKNFTLAFRYPTGTERQRLTLLHREVTPEQQRTIVDRQESVAQLVEDLENQRLFAQDLDPSVRARLRAALQDVDD